MFTARQLQIAYHYARFLCICWYGSYEGKEAMEDHIANAFLGRAGRN